MPRSLLVISLLLCPALASADADAPPPKARTTVELDATELTGEVQGPAVAVFISRENLAKDYRLELRESFVPKILKSVEESPF